MKPLLIGKDSPVPPKALNSPKFVKFDGAARILAQSAVLWSPGVLHGSHGSGNICHLQTAALQEKIWQHKLWFLKSALRVFL
jgi:hypothetical protein